MSIKFSSYFSPPGWAITAKEMLLGWKVFLDLSWQVCILFSISGYHRATQLCHSTKPSWWPRTSELCTGTLASASDMCCVGWVLVSPLASTMGICGCCARWPAQPPLPQASFPLLDFSTWQCIWGKFLDSETILQNFSHCYYNVTSFSLPCFLASKERSGEAHLGSPAAGAAPARVGVLTGCSACSSGAPSAWEGSREGALRESCCHLALLWHG